jgi:hypothetical protein
LQTVFVWRNKIWSLNWFFYWVGTQSNCPILKQFNCDTFLTERIVSFVFLSKVKIEYRLQNFWATKYSQPMLTTTSEQQPPVYKDQYNSATASLNLTFIRAPLSDGHFFQVSRVAVVHRCDCSSNTLYKVFKSFIVIGINWYIDGITWVKLFLITISKRLSYPPPFSIE